MKASTVALVAGSLLGAAVADSHHQHMKFHAKKDAGYIAVMERGEESANATCGCEFTTSTIYGSTTLAPQAPPAPTPIVSSWSTPGTYTVVHSTITLTETTTVASASVATLTPGTGTYGGVTTTVPSPCTVTVPVGTVSGSGKATTSVVVTSTHTCTEAGVCVVGGTSTSVSVSTISVYPVPATYSPGTYTVPDTTVTVTETGTVYVCPFSSIEATPTSKPAPPPASSPASSPASTPVSPVEASSAPAAPPKPAKPSVPVSPVLPSLSLPSAPKPTAQGYIGGHKPAKSGGITPNGNKWAMSYTPYDSTGGCKSASQVASDMADIKGKGFSAVRLYATDCSGLQNVGAGCKANGLKMLAGVFIGETGISAAQEQVDQIASWAQWDLVEMIVVGNEAVFNEYCSASELAGFISSAKGQFQGAGYTGPVTTTEPLGTLQANNDVICPAVDVVAANIQPFFNGGVVASGAGDFVASQLELTGQQCPGKTAYNLECGWPTGGSPNGDSIPGPAEQQQAMDAIMASSAAGKTVVFSYQNDGWKAPGAFGVEQFFGVADIFAGL